MGRGGYRENDERLGAMVSKIENSNHIHNENSLQKETNIRHTTHWTYQRQIDEEVTQSPTEIPSQAPSTIYSTKDYDFFVRKCKYDLFFGPSIDDSKIISQVDYTNFLVNICIMTQKCSLGYTESYSGLTIDLQLQFLRAECPPLPTTNSPDEECLQKFYNTDEGDGEFGFILAEYNLDNVEMKIDNLCTSIYPYASAYYGGTAGIMSMEPSLSPSTFPSTLAPSSTPPISDIPRSTRSLNTTNGIITLVSIGTILLFLCLYIGCKSRGSRDKDDDDIINNNSNGDAYDKLEEQPVDDTSENQDSEVVPEVKAIVSNDDEGEDDSDHVIQFDPESSGPDAHTFSRLQRVSNSRSDTDGKDSITVDTDDKDSITIDDIEKDSITIDDSAKDSINTDDLVRNILDADDAATDELVKDILNTDDTTDTGNVNKDTNDGSDNDQASVSTPNEHKTFMQHLDAAIADGDWAAVATLAGEISDSDNSPGSGTSSNRDVTPVNGENLSEEERVETINKLVVEGDWIAVGATANAFETEPEDKKSFESPPRSNKRKNLLDFITMPWSNSKDGKKNEGESSNKSEEKGAALDSSNSSSGNKSEKSDSDDSSNIQTSDPDESSLMDPEEQRSIRLRASQLLYEAEQRAQDRNSPKKVSESNAIDKDDTIEGIEEKPSDKETPNASVGVEESSQEESSDTDSRTGWSSNSGKHSFLSQASSMDSEKIETLEKLIDCDDWTGIVTKADSILEGEEEEDQNSSDLDSPKSADNDNRS